MSYGPKDYSKGRCRLTLSLSRVDYYEPALLQHEPEIMMVRIKINLKLKIKRHVNPDP